MLLVTWVTKLYFENGDKNVRLLFCFAKQWNVTPLRVEGGEDERLFWFF